MQTQETQFQRIARDVLSRCEVQPDERVSCLFDAGSMPDLVDAFMVEGAASGAHPVKLNAGERSFAFQELPESILNDALVPGLVVDLTSLPWLYSDSLTRYVEQSKEAGSRLALIWGDEALRSTLLNSPFDERLMERATAAEKTIGTATSLTIRSGHGTEFQVRLLERASMIGSAPVNAGEIGAALYASVTAPFDAKSANGVLVFRGAGRLQGPTPTPFFTEEAVEIHVADGYVTSIKGEGGTADLLRAWRSDAPTTEVDRIMDCNIGFDPRGNLRAADNMVVHCSEGGIMIGIGSPYEYRAEGSLTPGFHLDLLFDGCDVVLDDRPFIQKGAFV